mgnify:CR=1 FL=1
MKRWTCGFGMAVMVGCLVSSVARADLLVAGFETTDTPSYQVSEQLHHAGGEPYTWNWSGDNIGVISSDAAAVHTGAQGLDATRSTTANSQLWWTRPGAFTAAQSGRLSWSLAVRATGWANSPDSLLEIAASDSLVDDFGGNGSRSAWLTLRGTGNLYGWNGSGAESELASGLDLTQWLVIRMEIDLDQSTYDVFLNNSQVGSDLNFYGSGVSSVASLQFKEYNNGQSSGGVYLDDVNLSVVPEPGLLPMALLGSAAFWLVNRKRIRNA